jgi:hypothetical protein
LRARPSRLGPAALSSDSGIRKHQIKFASFLGNLENFLLTARGAPVSCGMKMKNPLATLVALAAFAASAQAAVLLNGSFEIYKPGTGYTVTGTLNGSLFQSYVQGVGIGRNVTGTVGTVTWDMPPPAARPISPGG